MAESNVVRELLVRLGVITDAQTDIKKFDAAIDGVKKGLQSAGEYAGQAKQQVALLVGQIAAAGAAGAAAVGSLVYLSDETATYAQNVERQAAALGMTTDTYQELRSTFERFGVDQRDVADLFAQISQQSTAAQGGAKGIESAFNALGIASKDLKGKDPEGILLAIADGAARTTDPVTRLSALSSLLGEDLTKKLAPLLQQGSKGIEQFRQEIRDLGGVMDAEGIKKAGAYKDAVGDLKILITGIGHEIGVVLLPVLTRLARTMQDWIEDTRRSPRRLRQVGTALLFVAGAAGTLFTALAAFRVGSAAYYGIQAVMALAPALNALGAAMTAAKTFTIATELAGGAVMLEETTVAATGLTGAMGSLFAGISATGVVGIFAAIVAGAVAFAAQVAVLVGGLALFYVALEDVFMFLTNSGDTVLGRFVDSLAGGNNALGAWARTGLAFRDIIGQVLSILSSLATLAGQTLAPILDRLAPYFTTLTTAITSLGSSLVDAAFEKAFAPFYLFEALLTTLLPMITRLADGLASAAANGTGLGGLFANTVAANLPAGLGGTSGAGLATAGATAGGSSSRSYVDQSSTSVNINGAQSPAATAGALLPVVQEQRAKSNRATRDTLAGGER